MNVIKTGFKEDDKNKIKKNNLTKASNVNYRLREEMLNKAKPKWKRNKIIAFNKF